MLLFLWSESNRAHREEINLQLCSFELHLWNLCICTYINGWKVGAFIFKSYKLKTYPQFVASWWCFYMQIVFHSTNAAILRTANVMECKHLRARMSDVPWTYILSPLLPCWLEPCLGVDGLDVNSMTPGWQRVMWRPFHVVLFYLHAASFRRTGFGTSLPGQKKLGDGSNFHC